MINFKKYSSIDNVITRDFMERVWAEMPTDLEWVVQEKVHGANTSFLCDGDEVRFAKRTSVLSEDDKFYDFTSLLEAYKPRVVSLFKRIRDTYPAVSPSLCSGRCLAVAMHTKECPLSRVLP